MAISYKDIKEKTVDGYGSKLREQTNTADTTDYAPNAAWWLATSPYEVLDNVKQMLGLLGGDLYTRLQRYRLETRLYGVPDYLSNWGNTSAPGAYFNSLSTPDRLTFNVIQSNVDTLVSKVSKIRPRARFLTNGGNFKSVNAAKKLGYFSDGIFNENDIYSVARHVIRDAITLGDGFVHVYNEDNRVKLERVIPYEILVDERECVSSQSPTHMYRLKLVTRAAVMGMFPDKVREIANSSQLFGDSIHSTSAATDQIEILEAWHLPVNGGGGKHLLAIPDCLLVEEEYTEKRFPFARISWSQAFTGYWSQSLCQQLKSTQLEINKLLAVVQRSYNLAGSFKILVQNGSQIPTESFNNAIGTIIKFTGAKPEYITPPILPPEFYRQIDVLIDRSYKISGVSQLSAYSEKPAGLDAAVALREFSNIESSRFLEFSQDVEQFFVDIAKSCMSTAKRIAENNDGSYPVSVRGPKSLTRVDIKDIALGEEDYSIGVFPASSLPQDPAGRIAAIDDLVKRGLLDPVEQRELLSFPDIEASNMLSTSQDEYLKQVFEKMLEDGTYSSPDKLDNLGLAQKLAVQYYALGKKLGESEDKLELIRQYVFELMELQAPAPVVPNLPMPELGAQVAPSEAAQLSLPTASGALPGAEALVQGAALQAGAIPPVLA